MLRNIYIQDGIKLTGPRASDSDIINSWGEDSDFMRLVDVNIAHPIFAASLQPESGPFAYEFRIRLCSTDQLIGFVGIHNIEWNNQTGILGIGIGNEKYRSKGYGSQAIFLILQYAFCELNLHRVSLDVISYNQRAIKAYERAGFKTEGVIRQCVFRDGQRFDRILMGVLRSDWMAHASNP